MEDNDYISIFKENMHQGMLKNFRKCGCVAPVAFFLHRIPPEINPNGTLPPIPSIIPIEECLRGHEWKKGLSFAMREMCKDPLVIAAGIISEANCAKFEKDDKLGKLVQSGVVSINELKQKKDIIVMIFSTPISEEFFMYNVDIKNKIIGERLLDGKGFSGILTNFFGCNKN